MNTYLVGGAVRDRLLGLAIGERDWVVLGATPEAMTRRGFRPVGRDFPVFLHPETNEEYALARTERKSGHGYHGFTFHTAPDVSLEADLKRRDLTVNAMAEDTHGNLHDPFGGRADLEARVLRHVSPAFVEDPVRVLRVARFHARFAPLGFSVAEETKTLMRQMVANGEIDHLVPERVWAEMERALMQQQPAGFFELLRDVGALERILPELDAQFGAAQPERHHPEIDAGIHTLMVLAETVRLEAPLRVRFAALCHDFGKGVTPEHILPSHRGHEEAGIPLVEAACERLGVPRALRELAVLVTRWHLHVHRAEQLRPATILKVLEAADAFRRPERLDDLLLTCQADARGRLGFENRAYPQADLIRAARDAAADVDASALAASGLKGAEIGEALRQERTKRIKHVSANGTQ